MRSGGDPASLIASLIVPLFFAAGSAVTGSPVFGALGGLSSLLTGGLTAPLSGVASAASDVATGLGSDAGGLGADAASFGSALSTPAIDSAAAGAPLTFGPEAASAAEGSLFPATSSALSLSGGGLGTPAASAAQSAASSAASQVPSLTASPLATSAQNPTQSPILGMLQSYMKTQQRNQMIGQIMGIAKPVIGGVLDYVSRPSQPSFSPGMVQALQNLPTQPHQMPTTTGGTLSGLSAMQRLGKLSSAGR